MLRFNRIHLVYLTLLILPLTANNLFAQANQLPVRDYTNPNELVSLSPETKFSTAVEILNNFAKQFAQKIIINHAEISGPIGINIPTMPWRQALNDITGAHNLLVRTHPDYLEIVPETPEQSESEAESGLNMNSREIEIKATFFEGNKRLLRELGVDWSLLKNGTVEINNIAAQNVSQDVVDLNVDLQEIAQTGWEVSALFKTFEAANEGQILASPTIKVLEGVEGRIQIGQDFSIKQRDFAGNVIDQFFSTGTISSVTPHIISVGDTQFIHLEIDAEKSSAQPDPISTIINKQEATTEVLLLNGEETAIGGLYSNDKSTVRRGIPLLKDLPPWFFGLRYLFGYESKDVTQRELVILIKATIVPSIRERLQQRLKNRQQIMEQQRQNYPHLQDFQENK